MADFGDFVGAGLGEAVVDDAFGHGVVIISKQGPHIRARWVADVVPHTGGAVAIGQFAPMGVGIGHIFGALGHRHKQIADVLNDVRVKGPVESSRIIEPHGQALGTDRITQFPHQIAGDLVIGDERVGLLTGPQQKAIVVFGGQYHVFGTRIGKQLGPCAGVPLGCPRIEVSGKSGIGHIAILFGMVGGGGAVGDPHRIHVPFGIGVAGKPGRPAFTGNHIVERSGGRCPARHRIQPPVNENPQLGFVEPGRHLVRLDGSQGTIKRHRYILSLLILRRR